MPHRYRLLLHPLFLSSLALLILNDLHLKYAYASWITGKLSDFSGLFVAGVFLSVILRDLARKALITLHLCIGLSFVIWKLAPVEILLNQIESWTSLIMPARVKDPTDLIALPVLFVSLILVLRHRRMNNAMSARFPARIAAVTVGVVAGFSIIATSFVDRVKLNPHETFDGSISDAEFLYEFERLLIADDISIDHRHVTDTGYLYDISLGHRTRISHRGRNWQGNRSIDGTICVRRGVSSGLWTISEINFTAYNRELDGYTLTARIRKNVIQPLEEKYK